MKKKRWRALEINKYICTTSKAERAETKKGSAAQRCCVE
jgi:hypothetical protein